MRVAHITDLHLSVSEPEPQGLPQWDRVDRVLNAIENEDIELVICGGDVALHAGDGETYRRFAGMVANRPFDTVLQPGNHDDRTLFHEFFGRRYRFDGTPLDRSITWRGITFLLLDSSRGVIDDGQIRWLMAAFQSMPSVAAMFTHYPVFGGMNHIMDTRFALQNSEAVRTALTELDGNVSIFCGHYHMEHLHRVENVSQWITPAIYVQIDPVADTFTVAHTRPAFRVIDFSPHGSVDGTEVIYLDG